ncbi:membrane protein insertase YidC, partial [Mycetohabitans sp. B5]|uniref:membrane protein insertase YidC n=1 Tax=Mycetohabitans sp. B5 TaxID=2841846 RepID=UPI001EFF7C35
MDIKRTVLWVIFFMSVVMLYDNWQRDHGRPSLFFPNTTPTQTATSAASGTTTPGTQPADLPQTAEPSSAPGTAPAVQLAVKGQQIHFKTDVYDGDISTVGGTLSRLSLVKGGGGTHPALYIPLFALAVIHRGRCRRIAGCRGRGAP